MSSSSAASATLPSPSAPSVELESESAGEELSSLSSPTAIQHVSYFACSLQLSDVSEEVIHHAVRYLADTLTCALAAATNSEIQRLRQLAAQYPAVGAASASIWGSSQRCSPSYAALVNTAMIRWLDSNDLFISKPPISAQAGGHCSDSLGGVLALVDTSKNTGQELLTALIIAYETQAALASCMTWMDVGFHSVSQINYAVPAAAAAFPQYRLTPSVLTNAIALSATTGMCAQTWLKQGKGKKPASASSSSSAASHGGVPTIKSVAPGLACQHGVESLALAQAGVTASPDALETILNFFNPVERDFDPLPFAQLGRAQSFSMHRHLIKQYAAQFNLQAVIATALDLHKQGVRIGEVESLRVLGHSYSCAGVQGSAEAFRPSSQGSADHSTPYVIYSALLHGSFTADLAYGSDGWLKEECLAAMARMMLVVDEAFEQTRIQTGALGCEIQATLKDGRVLTARRSTTAGHPDSPLSDDQLLDKMRTMLTPLYGEHMADTLWEACNDLVESKDCEATKKLFELLCTEAAVKA